MARKIDTDAVINSIRLAEQAGDVVAIAAGYWQLYAKEGGLYHEDDNEVVAGPLGTGLVPGGRLTLTTGVPVTTADVNNATTVYYTPYIHNMIELFDGARWIPVPFAEVSIAVGAYTASKPYDIWGYLAAGTVALDSTVWTDGTTRATALAYQDGRLVKSGTATRRYLGTIYIDADQKTDSSVTKRFVWNYYNRVMRWMYKYDGTGHNYTTGTYRSWNNDAAIRVEFVQGVLEDAIDASIGGTIDPSGDAVAGYVAIGLDVTNANSLNLPCLWDVAQPGWSFAADARLPSAEGYHFLQALEYGATTVAFSDVYLRAKILS